MRNVYSSPEMTVIVFSAEGCIASSTDPNVLPQINRNDGVVW